MTCKNCNHEFCWLCKQSYDIHDETSCILGYGSKAIFAIYTIWHVLAVLIPGFAGMTARFLITLVLFLLRNVIWFNSPIVGMILFVVGRSERRRDRQLETIYGQIALFSFAAIYYYGIILSWIYSLVMQALLIGIALGFASVCQTWLEFVV